MKIAVISDTHLKKRGQWIPSEVERVLLETGFIVHCGDLVELFVYEELKKLGRVVAVYGNMDSAEVRKVLPEKVTFEVEGYRIGVTHGYGPPEGIEDRVASQFQEKVDVILFGHSHRTQNEFKDGVLFFNPGSPTDKKYAPFNSYGIIELTEKGVRGRIIRL